MIESCISKLTVIQSLPKGDSQTGRRLYEDIEMLNICHDRGLKMEYKDICCKEELFVYLSQLQVEASNGLWPLIHLECHGLNDQAGISLGDGSYVLWRELYPYFSAINVNTKLNLILVAGLCYGAYFSELFSPIDKAPFLMAIGPTKQIKNRELEKSFYKFYESYFLSSDGTATAKKLINKNLNEGYFYITMATTIFKKFFKEFLFELNNEKDIEKIYQETTSNGNKNYLSKGHTKNKYCEAVFNRYHDRFFMVDLYPENRERFKLSFKDIEHELQL